MRTIERTRSSWAPLHRINTIKMTEGYLTFGRTSGGGGGGRISETHLL